MRAAILLLIVALLVSVPGHSTAERAPGAPQLWLHRTALEAPGVGLESATRALVTAPATGYAIVQFRGPILSSDRAALQQTGVAILEYIPDFAYLVRGSSTQLAASARLPMVYRQVPLTTGDKLSPALIDKVVRGDSGWGQLKMLGWQGGMLPPSGPQSIEELLQLAAQPDVRWIEPASQPRLSNDVARTIMHVDQAAWAGAGLYGTGQVVAVADSGLDTGVPATLSPDFAGRLVATHVLSAGGDLGDSNGHGTHVAGSIAGAGVSSGSDPASHDYVGSFAGVAPEAGLVVQAFEADAAGNVIGLDPDYYQLFSQAYNSGARLHSDSWGDYTGPVTDTEAMFGGYPYGSQRTDQFIWEHPDMAVFFASGNSGADGTPGITGFCTNGNGIVDPDSLVAPGTAKNVITVGASESLRSGGGLSGLPWLLLDLCFSTQPIATDTISNNANGMAAFSSRGPTDDGRVKPDIVAPGTNIVSNRSHYPEAGTLWGQHETNPDYAYSGGTSMATPLVAGAGVLVRQWLTLRGIAQPSAAAIKAVLLNTAANMAPGQYGIGSVQEIPATTPNSVNGWGRADLNFMGLPLPYTLWVDDHTTGMETSETVTYRHSANRSLEVVDSSQPLRVLLAWTDPPASLSAAHQLVNDLDLRVIGPDGTVYYGNNQATGDRINNVEGLVINNPPLGEYRVEVQAFNVPIDTQPYALAVAGPLTRPSAGAQLSLTKSAYPPLEVAPGGRLSYTLSLSANSAINVPIVLSDTLPLNTTFVSASDGGAPAPGNARLIRWTVPQLAEGQVVTRTLVVDVAANAPDGTAIVNQTYRADAAGQQPGIGVPVTVTVRDAVIPPTPQLTLSKTANPTPEVAPGDLITYTLTVGVQDATANAVSLQDTLPANTSFVAATGNYSRSGNVVTWSLGSLGSGQSAIRTLTVRVNQDVSDGTVISNATYLASASNAATVTGSAVQVTVRASAPTPHLSLTKTANAATVAPGGLITYTLTLGVHDGPVTTATLSDTLPANTSFVAASGAHSQAGGVVTWTIGSLASDQSVSRTLTVRVNSSTVDGTLIRNTAYGAAAQNAASVGGPPVNVTVRATPRLTLSKTVNPTQLVRPGQLVTYTLSVGALDAAATSVTLRDTVPAGTTFVAASGSYSRATEGNNTVVIWPLATLARGQNVTRTLTVRINSNAANGATISNAAYQVGATNAATVTGTPVNLRVNVPPTYRIWLPYQAFDAPG